MSANTIAAIRCVVRLTTDSAFTVNAPNIDPTGASGYFMNMCDGLTRIPFRDPEVRALDVIRHELPRLAAEGYLTSSTLSPSGNRTRYEITQKARHLIS